MPAVTLHMGSGKTGSSSIQALLGQQRERLLGTGVLYPRVPGHTRHVRLGLALRSDEQVVEQPSWPQQRYRDPAAFRAWFEAALLEEVADSGADRVLFSDEALYGSNHSMLEQLRRLTDAVAHCQGPKLGNAAGQRQLRLLVYLRRQDDHLASRYQQVVKTGETRRLVERTEQTDFAGVYDYLARLRGWQRRLDPSSLLVRPFERTAFAGGSLLSDFVQAAGLELNPDEDPVGLRNASLDAETVEFLRLVNLVRRDGALPQWRVAQQRRLVDQLTAVSAGPTLTLPEAVLESFMAPWIEGNRTIAREFLGTDDGVLFHTARKTGGTTTEQRLDPERIDDLLAVTDIPEAAHERLRALGAREAARE